MQSKETSCYLYTMTQTDDLLSKLYAQLRNTGDSFSMVYFSDHGLAFKERGKEVQYLARRCISAELPGALYGAVE